MCRWFAYIGHEPILLEDALVMPKHALIKQINDHYLPELLKHYSNRREVIERNVLLNIDGFGVSWYTHVREEFGECEGPRPTTYKSVRPPLNDRNFRSLCANTKTNAVFAHIRATSGSPVVETNNHPFEFGRHLFMHNGTVAQFSKIRRNLLLKISKQAYENVMGTTDTEHVAALFFTHLGDMYAEHTLNEFKQAMLKTLNDIIELLVVEEESDDTVQKGEHVNASSLNLAVTDGKKMMAIRFRNDVTEDPPSLYYSTTAGVSLNRKFPGTADQPPSSENGSPSDVKKMEEHRAHVIIASEPMTYNREDWHLIPKNNMVFVNEDMQLSLENIQLRTN
ncbi:unnamed protein product [Didymodactylos carnosus]|uniref:Glutamine amidotransferase type-2 domain-containing protein n=1 Tax=Didymodactylos carnosus TaxID=1234261 RepID=A0A814VLV4_9BILA|nr:unnamed protein product [Didymodactylos carnosus]CAF1190154.1 unnamed protein product [Didymodactylos carnosus]CAF3805867.1 unnamed protein product [Didymodactylos carnosus]CAF3954255.1 unnamed protein product [Didymodactylos carnosus]